MDDSIIQLLSNYAQSQIVLICGPKPDRCYTNQSKNNTAYKK